MKQTTRDNLIYLGVGLTIAAAFIFYAFYTERTTGRIQEIPGPILWGILSTPGIVAVIFEQFWQFRRRRSLWVISIIAASINVLAMFIAYSLRWEPPVIVWMALTVLWLMVILYAAGKFVAHDHSR